MCSKTLNGEFNTPINHTKKIQIRQVSQPFQTSPSKKGQPRHKRTIEKLRNSRNKESRPDQSPTTLGSVRNRPGSEGAIKEDKKPDLPPMVNSTPAKNQPMKNQPFRWHFFQKGFQC